MSAPPPPVPPPNFVEGPRLILASASPRRRDLLATLGIPFEVIPSRVVEETDEVAILAGEGERLPELLANRLALTKAWDVAERLRLAGERNVLVLGADTVVAAGDPSAPVVLGKPRTHEEARTMLELLSGAAHSVYTGASLVYAAQAGAAEPPRSESDVVRTEVTFRALSREEIDGYIDTGEPFDKAGAYGIQGRAARFVASVQGDYHNVVGLPLDRIREMLRPYFPNGL